MKSTSPQNPNPLKKKLASRFLKAMKKLSHKISSSPSPPSTAERRRRHRAVRAAAYASMASAVGPRRAWSRALLRKLRSKATATSGRKTARRNPRNIGTRFLGLNELCDVVPGGKAMDSCSLLSETGHYIKCLRAQVQIMREILDSSSSSSSSRIL
ncbi:transcription factor IBH1-like [Salvia miltiorrhiza]|uniref:transcription factor IBH1-like n=1 Tax=Salvia miltiorrhiza TaxID=226208 RepID=UPI0025AB8E2C|nr:transcription factor IBH1-like [Salvia miltiorrhiza]